MKKQVQTKSRQLNTTGSAMLLVLSVISLIAILGFISLSTVAANWQMQALRRKSERNFYALEMALDEIYSGLGQVAGNAMEASYEKVLGGLYTTYKTNDGANVAFAKDYIHQLSSEDYLGVDLSSGTVGVEDGLGEALAEKLKAFSVTIQPEKLTLTIGDIIYTEGTTVEEQIGGTKEEGDSEADGDGEEEEGHQQVLLKDLQLTYVNPDTMMESSITVDLTIRTPRVRFINEKEALQDYILVANGGISIGGVDGATADTVTLQGNVYGSNVQISHTNAVMESNLVTAGNELAVNNGGSLSIMPEGSGDEETEEEYDDSGDLEGDEKGDGDGSEAETYTGTSHVWAQNVKVFQNSQLEIDGGNLYVGDDLTLQQDENSVKLSGGYYGYGNEGETEASSGNTYAGSSAILLNGKRNTVDFREADTILLAGRAYLNFKEASEAYPLGESMSVKASQSIYLVPIKTNQGMEAIEVDENGNDDKENFVQASSNPVIFPEGTDKILIRVKKLGVDRAPVDPEKTGTYQITKTTGAGGSVSYTSTHNGGDETAVIVGVKDKLYIYRSFQTKEEQTEYFKEYVEKNGESFGSYLENAGMSASTKDSFANGGTDSTSGGITLNGSGNFYTAASLYEVSGDGETLFRLVNNEKPTALGIVELSENCKNSFKNLQTYLAETVKTDGGTGALPASTYARLTSDGSGVKWDITDFEGLYECDESKGILVTNQDVTLNAAAGTATDGTTRTMSCGLIVTSGNVTVNAGTEGSGEWQGMILAGGTISVSGNVNLIADVGTYESYLEEEQTSKYFYGYSDTDPSVFDRYDDFLIMEHWERGTRKYEGE